MHTPRLRIHLDPTHLWTLFIENGVLLSAAQKKTGLKCLCDT